MKLDYKLFKGVSVQLTDLDNAEDKAMKIASRPVVKNVWPLYTYSIPKPNVEWVGAPPKPKSAVEKRREKATNETEGFSPHVMTQVDKLHKKGVKGKGIRIAIIDTGVSGFAGMQTQQ